MTTIEKMQELLPTLTVGEKAQILQWIALDLSNLFPGIERTRIPVWLLIQARKLGSSDIDILRAYPSLRAEDLSNAWNYYRFHKTEIEEQILENEMA